MTVSVLALAVALSAQQQAVPQAPAIDTPAVTTTASADQQRVDPRDPQSGERPHTVGLGSQIALSNRGAGGGARFWFGDRLGVNVNAFWYKPRSRYSVAGNEPGSTFGAFPSFILMLTKPDSSRDIDVRPYVGGGLSYVSASRRITTSGITSNERVNGTGGQAFGGVELTFKEADWMTISAEGIYYRLPVRFVNTAVVDGFNYLLAFHFYLK